MYTTPYEMNIMPYEKIPCEKKYVADAMGDEFKHWTSRTPVFINAPTGSGKNTFIFDTLAPHAKSTNNCVLLLSNRVALNRQEKRKLWEKLHDYSISDQELDSEFIFDNIIIFSYQNFINQINYLLSSPLFNCIKYVIYDEAHYFLSDALFNNETDLQLLTTINLFSNAIRIYMSATAERIAPFIKQLEESILTQNIKNNSNSTVRQVSLCLHKPKFLEYKFPRDYSDYVFHFFKSWDVLCKYITHSSQDEKWLIFVEAKSEYKEIEALLTANKELEKQDINFLTADDKNTSVYQLISRKEKFKTRVLVSTIALDNGINIRDDQLKHIVINSCDPVSMIQMVGRKRRAANENVNLYFKTTKKEDLIKYKASKRKLLNSAVSFDKNSLYSIEKNWGDLDKDLQKLFRVRLSNNYSQAPMAKANDLAKVKLEYDIAVLEDLIANIEYYDDGYGFARSVLQWFHIDPDSESLPERQLENLVSTLKDEEIEELTSYIKSNIEENHIFRKGERNTLISLFADSYENISQQPLRKQREEGRVAEIINYVLEKLELPYEFNKIKEKGSQKNPGWFFSDKAT